MAKYVYHLDLCDQVREAGKRGLSLHEFALEVEIPLATLNSFKDEYSDFKEACIDAHDFAQGWWEGHARSNLGNRNYNNSVWSFCMKNKFGWKDVKEVKQETYSHSRVDVNSLSRSEVEEQLENMLRG